MCLFLQTIRLSGLFQCILAHNICRAARRDESQTQRLQFLLSLYSDTCHNGIAQLILLHESDSCVFCIGKQFYYFLFRIFYIFWAFSVMIPKVFNCNKATALDNSRLNTNHYEHYIVPSLLQSINTFDEDDEENQDTANKYILH